MSPQQVHRTMIAAVAQHQRGQLAEAERAYREVLRHDKRNADAMNLLGLIEHQHKNHQAAIDLIQKATTIRPQPEFFVNLSQAYRGAGRLKECVDTCRRAVQLGPKIPEAWNNLGSALKDSNLPQEAIKAFERAIQLRPNYAVAHNNLGNALGQVERPAEAEAEFRVAIAMDPNYAEAYSNLGFLIGKLGRLDESVALCRRAIAIKPDFVAAHMNLGTALHQQGKLAEGNEAYLNGGAIDPNHVRLHENLLGAFTQTTRWSPQDQLKASVEWGRRFATPQAEKILPHGNDRNPDRKLRIGYASPDFRRHSVAYFFEPILEHHDRDQFEITLYANNETPDEVTDRIRNRADRWRDVTSLSEEELAKQIRADGMDVLIDLAGHTAGNRLVAFGFRPAPVQMTYLGWPATTGVSAVDYRLTDEISDPPGMTDAYYSEKLIRLPAPFLCYRAPENSPEVADPPVLRNGYITFGSFNRAPKAGPETIPLWARVLQAVPNSKLLLKSRGFGDEGSRRRILDGFAACGVANDRIQLVEAIPSLRAHLESYGQIDIALDTYPYHGTTTTCEALWMGVPVISLIGQTHVSRVGLTLLKSIGRDDLAAATADGYISLAVRLASDPTGLRESRHQLRSMLIASPLSDAARLVRAMELSFQQAFRTWCAAGA
jgi:protein O-GlcNAc transferase